MALANGVNLVGFYRHNTEFKEFFTGFGNTLNSCLVIVYCFLLSAFGVYFHVKIHCNQHLFQGNENVKEQFENFLD